MTAAWRFLSDLMRDADRFKAMATPWYAAKGKAFPGDPAAPIIAAVQANGGEADKRLGLLVLPR